MPPTPGSALFLIFSLFSFFETSFLCTAMSVLILAVDLAGLKLRDLLVSTVLGFKDSRLQHPSVHTCYSNFPGHFIFMTLAAMPSDSFIYLFVYLFIRNVFALNQLLASFSENRDQVLLSNLHLSWNSLLSERKQLPWFPSRLQRYSVAWQRRFRRCDWTALSHLFPVRKTRIY